MLGFVKRGVAAVGFALMKLQGAVNQREMAEGLRGVAEVPLRPRIPFLTEQAHIVTQAKKSLK